MWVGKRGSVWDNGDWSFGTPRRFDAESLSCGIHMFSFSSFFSFSSSLGPLFCRPTEECDSSPHFFSPSGYPFPHS